MLHALIAFPFLAQGITLRFQPPVGASVAYSNKLEMTQTVPGMPEPIVTTTTGTMTLRVVSREGGVTTLETKTGASKATITPASMAAGMKERLEKIGSNQTTVTRVDEFGALKEAKIGATGPDAALARQIGSSLMESGAQGITYPTQALAVGDTWNATLDMGKALQKMLGPQAKATGKIPSVFRLVSIDKQGELTLAKVSMTMKGEATATVGDMAVKSTMNMTGEFVMDVATGFLRSSSSVGDTTIAFAGQTMRQHIVTTTTAL